MAKHSGGGNHLAGQVVCHALKFTSHGNLKQTLGVQDPVESKPGSAAVSDPTRRTQNI